MGLVVSAYGPLLGLLSGRFGVSLPVAGSVISVHFAGGLAGVLIAMQTLARLPGRLTVMAALAVIGAGCAAVAVASVWPLFLCGVAVLGVGFGALVISLNQLVAYSEGRRRTALLNVLNGGYSFGAVIGPVLVAAFASAHFSLLFGAAAAVAALLILPATAIAGRLPVALGARGWPDRLVGVFVAAFVLYVAIETGAGGWITSHLASTGMPAGQAATATSAFWLALVAGRVLIAIVPTRASERAIVLTGSVLAAIALLVAIEPRAAVIAYVVTGLAIAPIFPTGIAWLAKLRPGDARATAWLYPAASVGGTLGPGAIGVVVGTLGISWTPAVLAAIAVLMTVAFAAVTRRTV